MIKIDFTIYWLILTVIAILLMYLVIFAPENTENSKRRTRNVVLSVLIVIMITWGITVPAIICTIDPVNVETTMFIDKLDKIDNNLVIYSNGSEFKIDPEYGEVETPDGIVYDVLLNKFTKTIYQNNITIPFETEKVTKS